jgi:hypothetical protein
MLDYLKLLFVFLFSALYISCYNVDRISFEHENFSRSGNPYDDHRNYDIIPCVFDNKAFLIAIHSTYVYDSTLVWIKDKSFILKMDVSIYSGQGIGNIIINSCEIILDLFNNPVGCLTSLADLADFLQKSAKSAVFQRKLFNN